MDVKEKYKQRIEKLNKEYIHNKKEIPYCKDEEAYHIEFDILIIDLLKEIGYEEISELYDNARGFFLYS